MAYLGYDRYVELGGSAYGEDGFDAAEARAELILDNVTMDRLHSMDWSRWEGRIETCMVITIETLPMLESAYTTDVSGASIYSFSNDVNTIYFNENTGSLVEDALSTLVTELQSLLPVELCSTCVRWGRVD